MKTERLSLSQVFFESSIKRSAEILNNDGIVAIPTETVYGLAASAYSKSAVEKIFIAKGRPQDNPLIVHISHLDMLNDITSDFSDIAKKCADAFWPGPFTMVLKRGEKIPKSVSAGLDTVAVRMPSDDIARQVIEASGLPLAAPSANISGAPSPTSATHVLNDLDGKIDAVIMGDDCGVGVESTVVSLCTNPPRLLRPGGVTVEQLKEVIPDLVIDPAVLAQPKSDEKVASPGMKYKHYAPKTETVLVSGDSEAYVGFVNTKSDCLAICFDDEYESIKTQKIAYGDKNNEETFAKNLFSVLRKADDYNVKTVYIHSPSKQGVGLAVYNRLIRAASFKEIVL